MPGDHVFGRAIDVTCKTSWFVPDWRFAGRVTTWATTVAPSRTSDSSTKLRDAADWFSTLVRTRMAADVALTSGVVTNVPHRAMRSVSVNRSRT